MSTVMFDPVEWAEREFDECELGDERRNERLKIVAAKVAARPDGSTPDQIESWGDLKAAYRLFGRDEVTFQAIIEPHCRHTRDDCRPGDVKLILDDTTELDFGPRRKATGLGPVGNGSGRGFFVHSGLMVDRETGRIEGMAGQEIFHRKEPAEKKADANTKRRSKDRESVVWGRLIDRIGAPPEGVTWIHVCDRGADDFEVMCRARRNGCDFVIRASKLNRKVISQDGRKLELRDLLDELPTHGTREVEVLPTPDNPGRTAVVTLRYGQVHVPRPKILSPWLRENGPWEPLRLSVVELREEQPPKGAEPIRWVLYATGPATTDAEADQVIADYKRRPTIEDYHKAYKTGSKVESRQYRTTERLQAVAGLLSIVAVRLLQLKTAALETPDRPAEEVAPAEWVKMLQRIRNIPVGNPMTIRQFVRQLAGLGGFLGRKSDGEPGWITLWRGFEKLHLMLRGADAARTRYG